MRRLAIAALGSVMLAGCILVADFSGIDDGARSPSGDERGNVDSVDAGDGGALHDEDAGDGNAPDANQPCAFCDSFTTGLTAWTEEHADVGVEAAGDAPSAPNVLRARLPDGGQLRPANLPVEGFGVQPPQFD